MISITKKIIGLSLIVLLIGCDTASNDPNKVTSSQAVGDETDTMEECKYRLDQTAKKYNVTYSVESDERNKFVAYLIKDGTQTDLMAMCKKDGDLYSGIFQIPDQK